MRNCRGGSRTREAHAGDSGSFVLFPREFFAVWQGLLTAKMTRRQDSKPTNWLPQVLRLSVLASSRFNLPALRLGRAVSFLACLLLVPMALLAGEGGVGQSVPGADPRWAILVFGSSGEPELQQRYLKELSDLRGLLEGPLGIPRSQIFALFDDPKLNPAQILQLSTKENLAKVCKEIAARSGAEDTVFVFLEGHGSSDGKSYKLNLVGPDPTAEELAAILYSIPAQRFLVVNNTSCSGASVESLSGKGKIVVAATKSGNEKIVTRLGGYFIEAFVGNNADVDKNSRVSIFEAFNYAAQKVEERYVKERSLPTEHPVLSDNGDAQALSLADATARSNLLARTSYLDRGSPLLAGGTSPESQALAKEAQSLEKQIEVLKSAKDELTEEEYLKRLETLLLKLAEVQAKLRKK
jgi:hypothetical protein